jgi:hypothetical protein
VVLRPLTIQCPSCHSTDVTYTCEPKCCFNHICGACYTTFELATEALGRTLSGSVPPAVTERDCLAPTVACVRCDSLDVYRLEAADLPPGHLLCAACHAVLKLLVEAVDPR